MDKDTLRWVLMVIEKERALLDKEQDVSAGDKELVLLRVKEKITDELLKGATEVVGYSVVPFNYGGEDSCEN